MADLWRATVRYLVDGSTQRRVFTAAEISTQVFDDPYPPRRALIQCYDEGGRLVERFHCAVWTVDVVPVGES